MSSSRHLHQLSGYGRTEYHTHGDWIRVLVTMISTQVISINSLELCKWESCMACWGDQISRRRWLTVIRSLVRTIWSGWQRMDIRCSLMNCHLRLFGWFIKVHLFRQSPNIILTHTNSQKDHLKGTLDCIDKSFLSVIFEANQKYDGGIVWGGFHWCS